MVFKTKPPFAPEGTITAFLLFELSSVQELRYENLQGDRTNEYRHELLLRYANECPQSVQNKQKFHKWAAQEVNQGLLLSQA